MVKPKNSGLTFEENIDEINRLIKIHVSKWSLDGIPSMDKDDVASIIRSHIYKKFHLYNPNRPIGNWLTTTIKNRLKNLYRDTYYKYTAPCLDCPAYLGKNSNSDGECKLYGMCSKACGLYKEWEKTKQSAYNVNLPVTIEDHQNQINSRPFEELDFDTQIEDLKLKLSARLSETDYGLFCGIYLDNIPELQLIKTLKFSSKTEGLRRIKDLKNTIVFIVKEILKQDDVINIRPSE